jgi:Cu(I)/Ag(I) efflux system membrane fusion protein
MIMKALRYISILLFVFFACSKERDNAEDHAAEKMQLNKYTCPMHPQVVTAVQGQCPICGMNLVVRRKGDASNNDLMLNERQIRLANITTQKVLMQSLGETVNVNARLVVNDELTKIISSRAAGRVEKLFVKENGSAIQQGDPLYNLNSEELIALQRTYLLAKQQFEMLGASEKRYEVFLNASKNKLLLYGFTEKQIEELNDIDDIQRHVTFYAPSSGIISELAIVEGQYIAEGSRLFKIDDISHLWLEAEVYPSEISFVKIGGKVKANVGYNTTEATIIFMSPQYRSNSQVTIVRAEIDNNALRLKPGMQAHVLITNASEQALAIPVDAVIRDGQVTHVYVQKGKNTFRPQMVKTGVAYFNKVEIAQGLSEGDTVVVSGAYLLYSEMVLKKGNNLMSAHDHGAMQLANQVLQKKSEVENVPFTADPKFLQKLVALLPVYLELKDALVASNVQVAADNCLKLEAVLKNVDASLLKGAAHSRWMNSLNTMENALKAMKNSDDIGAQRAAFAQFSVSLYNSIKTFNVRGINLFYQFCPMAFDNKGAYWLSRDEQISNPYFGVQMLRCGYIKEILK